MNIVSLFPFNEYHRSNLHRGEFSVYNLGPDFLNLALVTFIFNVYKNRRWLQNHKGWISLLALITSYPFRSSLEAREKTSVSYAVKYKTIGY